MEPSSRRRDGPTSASTQFWLPDLDIYPLTRPLKKPLTPCYNDGLVSFCDASDPPKLDRCLSSSLEDESDSWYYAVGLDRRIRFVYFLVELSAARSSISPPAALPPC